MFKQKKVNSRSVSYLMLNKGYEFYDENSERYYKILDYDDVPFSLGFKVVTAEYTDENFNPIYNEYVEISEIALKKMLGYDKLILYF